MRRKTKSILSKAKPIADVQQSMSALFYGRSGTGKTTLASTFPNCLFIDINEHGTDSISDTDHAMLSIDDWSEFEDVYWSLVDEDHDYDTVIIDSVHALQEVAIAEAMDRNKKKESDSASQRDMGDATKILKKWCSNYVGLLSQGINIVFLSHERLRSVDTEDDNLVDPEIGPSLMPSFASFLMGAVNFVGNTCVKELHEKSKIAGQKSKRSIEYCLRIGPNGIYHTKIRKPKHIELPEFITDPSYEKIKDVMKGKTNQPTRKTRRTNRRK